MTGCSSMAPIRVPMVNLAPNQPNQHQLTRSQSTANVPPPVMSNPPPAERVRVRCNLFGSPDPAVIQRMMEEENNRVTANFRERYNFDIPSGKPLRQQSANITTIRAANNDDGVVVNMRSESPINLLQQEQAAYLARMKCVTPPQAIGIESRCGPVQKRHSKVQTSDALTPSQPQTGERHKPYGRQMILTEIYNQRKLKQYQRRGTANNSIVAESEAIEAADEDQSNLAVLTGCLQSIQKSDCTNKDLTQMSRVAADNVEARVVAADDETEKPSSTPEQHVEMVKPIIPTPTATTTAPATQSVNTSLNASSSTARRIDATDT